jgi:hypothetical protein
MVVVVRDTGAIGAILLVITILSLLSIVVLIFFLLQGRGNVMVIAIPGFPPESIMAGLALGLSLIITMRSIRKKSRSL